MKLDSYLMLEAVRERNASAIINIFSQRFPEIDARRDMDWRWVRAPWQIVEVRLKTPSGSFCWDDFQFIVDRRVFSFDGSHKILVRDDVYGKQPAL